MVTPKARREAVDYLEEAFDISQRRACKVLDIDRSSVRYRSVKPPEDPLRKRIREVAVQRRRFGYRRIHILLQRDGVHMNLKKLRRLYSSK